MPRSLSHVHNAVIGCQVNKRALEINGKSIEILLHWYMKRNEKVVVVLVVVILLAFVGQLMMTLHACVITINHTNMLSSMFLSILFSSLFCCLSYTKGATKVIRGLFFSFLLFYFHNLKYKLNADNIHKPFVHEEKQIK